MSESAAHGADTIRVESCQRIEVYRAEACNCRAPVHADGLDALSHLSEVAAGLHSVVLGEEQVLGQVRTAIAAAPIGLQRIAAPAIASARALRAETTFGVHTGHLLDRALQMAESHELGDVAIVGVGSVGRLVAQRASELGARTVTMLGRRHPEAAWFAASGFAFEPLGHLRNAGPFDVLVSCLGSSAEERDIGADLPEVRRLIVDLGTPRNLVGTGPAQLLTIADMLRDETGRRHSVERRKILSTRLRLLLAARLAMEADNRTTPVGRLRFEVERVRQAELERIARLHPELPPETADQITRSLVNQIFHLPSMRLRDDAELGSKVAALFAPDDAQEELPS